MAINKYPPDSQTNWFNSAWQWSHTFTFPDDVGVTAGAINYITPLFVPVRLGTIVRAYAIRYKIQSGTSVQFDIQKNGVATNSGFVATTTATTYDIWPDITFADGDELNLNITAVTGSPKNLSVSVYFEVSA